MVGLSLPISEKLNNIIQNVFVIGNFELFNYKSLYFVKMLNLVLILVFNFVFKLLLCYGVPRSWKSNSLTRKVTRCSFLGGLSYV